MNFRAAVQAIGLDIGRAVRTGLKPALLSPTELYIRRPLSGRWVQVSVRPLLSCIVACQFAHESPIAETELC
jgi:hypothetical protein